MDLPKQDQIERGTKLLTSLAVALAAFGFLIVEIHEGQFGFFSSNPFRPRVISAGFVFLLFVSIAGVAAFRFAEMMPRPTSAKRTDEEKRTMARKYFAALPSKICFYLFVLSATTFGFGIFIPSFNVRPFPEFLLSVVGLSFFFLGFPRSGDDHNPVSPWIKVVVLSVAVTCFAASFSFLQDGIERTIQLWLLKYSFISGFLLFLARKYSPLLVGNLLLTVPKLSLLPFVLLASFAQTIYPDISSTWGGGRLQKVRMHLSKESAYPNGVVDRMLIEETSEGFYIVSTGTRSAHFIPRSDVKLVEYVVDQ